MWIFLHHKDGSPHTHERVEACQCIGIAIPSKCYDWYTMCSNLRPDKLEV